MLTQLSFDSRTGNLCAFQQLTIVFTQGRQCFDIGLIGWMLLPYPGLPLGIQLGNPRPVPMIRCLQHLHGNIQRLLQGCVSAAAHPSFTLVFA